MSALEILEVSGDARFANAKRRWSEREALLLCRNGRFGEAAPLPGYSDDKIADVRGWLGGEQKGQMPPSLDWAFGTLNGKTVAEVPEMALAQVVATEEEASRAVVQGYAALKVKLGRDLEAELRFAERLRERFGLPLRFDANGSLSVDEAEHALARLAALGAEFVEEPVVAAALPELRKRVGQWPVPLALDESLRRFGEQQAIESGADFFVLKGMVLGEEAARRWLDVASRHRRQVVFSHCLDGPVSMGRAALLWAQHRSLGGATAQGLGAHSALGMWAATPVGAGLEAVCSAEGHAGRLARWANQQFQERAL